MSQCNSVDLKKIDQIDIKKQMTVYGFLRKHDIPVEIILVCILFYGGEWGWDENIKPSTIEFVSRTVTRKTGYKWATCFGRNVVDSGVHHWRFKAVKYSGYIRVGLFKEKYNPQSMVESVLGYDKPNSDYVFNWQQGYIHDPTKNNEKLKDYGIIAKEGDTCDVHIDLNKLQISFGVNTKMYGIAFDNIEKCKYRVAVYNNNRGDMVEMIEYSCYGPFS